MKRCGGGFGGKETRSVLLALPLAVAAKKLGRSVLSPAPPRSSRFNLLSSPGEK